MNSPHPSRSLIAVALLSAVASLVITSQLSANKITGDAAPATPDQVTFSEHIAPLVFNNCYECHREGQGAPFTLSNYREVKKRGRMMSRVMQRGYMPPWHPEEGHGEFNDSRRLSNAQLDLFAKWVAQDMPEGDPSLTPPLPEYPGGWRLGKPDHVGVMMGEFDVYADGRDIYRNFAVPLDFPEDKWVTGIEVRSSNLAVTHHVLFFIDQDKVGRKMHGRDGQPGFRNMATRGGSLGGWAVGATPRMLPDGLAMKLPAGADLVLASHFHPIGKPAKVELSVAFYFADAPPTRDLVSFQIPRNYGRFSALNDGIPAGAKNFKISGKHTLQADVELIQIAGHAHYLGKDVKATATLPDGTVQNLFYIAEWDFNWQGSYQYKQPVKLPKGTVLYGELNYDNSADNPFNQFDPPQVVKWGLPAED
jgi:mono/diheme cytochrome c family protein